MQALRSTYSHIRRLPKPDNDARDMLAGLLRLGFEVTTELDVDRMELIAALQAFTRRSVGADISLVSYAGHDIEIRRQLPSAGRCAPGARRGRGLRDGHVDDVLVSTSGAELRLVILDAYRNNPAGALNARGGDAYGERRQLRRRFAWTTRTIKAHREGN